jgi:nucleoside-diphosphate-sugar epimerase
MSRVFITGATGFIGSHVVRYFCEKQVEVGCLVREESDLTGIRGLPVRLCRGRLEDEESLIRATHGSDFVIHIAGLARDWGEYRDFYRINVEGSLNLLRACVANKINNIILTASNAVYGEDDYPGVKDESAPHRSHYRYFGDKVFPCAINHYRDTKTIAKEQAVEYGKNNGLNLTILEPVWVYGEREFHTGFYEYLKTVKAGAPFLPGSTRNKFHVVYAGDLARAYWLAYRKRLPGIHSFIIGNHSAAYLDQIYNSFCKAAGLQKPGNLPKFLVYPIGLISELSAVISKSKKPPLLTRGRVNLFYDNAEYSTKKAEAVLGFINEYTLEQGIAKTVQWYREQKLI